MLSEKLVMREQDLAKIANRLQVPLIVGDVLNGVEKLNDDVVFGIHEILSDDQPDSALLSIALSAYGIAQNIETQSPSIALLGIECERIISEYGMMWLQNAQSHSLDENVVFETLVHIPEDLECLSELLEIVKLTAVRERSDIAELCTILWTQASAQGLIAQTFLEGLNMFDDDAPWEVAGDMSGETESELEAMIADHALQSQAYTNNVIQFPLTSA